MQKLFPSASKPLLEHFNFLGTIGIFDFRMLKKDDFTEVVKPRLPADESHITESNSLQLAQCFTDFYWTAVSGAAFLLLINNFFSQE